jgi:hypothetical protein
MNPAPDAELASVGEYNHNWIVDAMTEFVIDKLNGEPAQPEYRWSAMLSGASEKKTTPKAKTTKTTKASEKKTQTKKAASSE